MALSAGGAHAEAQTVPDSSAQPRVLHGQDQQLAHALTAEPTGGDCSCEHAAPAALPAMFWDTLPAGESQHPDKLAMEAMMEELSPAERALNFKVGT